LQKISQALIKNFRAKKKLSSKELEDILLHDKDNIDSIDTIANLMIANGFPMEQNGDCFFLNTINTLYKDEIFCFVDIETNGSKPDKAQIIEIGALKVQNGKIIDKFESFIYNENVPKHIEKITNINTSQLKNAPQAIEALKDFKIFLSNSIFLAHSVVFDYNFISYYLDKFHLGKLENRKICTLKFAQKMIKSQKYSLSYFNEYLDLGQDSMHRAYVDAYVSYKLFEQCLKDIPQDIKTTEDLIKFIHN